MSTCNSGRYCKEAANGQMSMSKGMETLNKEQIGATANSAKGICREVATSRPQRTMQGLSHRGLCALPRHLNTIL